MATATTTIITLTTTITTKSTIELLNKRVSNVMADYVSKDESIQGSEAFCVLSVRSLIHL
jgi:hypothetical protein